ESTEIVFANSADHTARLPHFCGLIDKDCRCAGCERPDQRNGSLEAVARLHGHDLNDDFADGDDLFHYVYRYLCSDGLGADIEPDGDKNDDTFDDELIEI